MQDALLGRLRKGKVLVVPTIAAFLSFIFVVIEPLNQLGGS
jgi:hypothetical protein